MVLRLESEILIIPYEDRYVGRAQVIAWLDTEAQMRLVRGYVSTDLDDFEKLSGIEVSPEHREQVRCMLENVSATCLDIPVAYFSTPRELVHDTSVREVAETYYEKGIDIVAADVCYPDLESAMGAVEEGIEVYRQLYTETVQKTVKMIFKPDTREMLLN